LTEQPAADQGDDKLPPRELMKYSDLRGAVLRPLWPGFLYYGQTHTVCGPTDAGKSTLAGAIVAAATGGPRLPGMVRAEKGWAFLAGSDEINPELARIRLKGAGADLERVESLHHVQGEKACELAMPRDASQIIADIDGRSPGVIIIDVGPDLLPDGVSFIDNDAVAAYYRGWGLVGAKTGLAVVILVHPPWSQSSVVNARAGGATKWTTCPDVFIWLVLENEETHKHVMGVKRSRCGERPPALSFWTELVDGPAVVRRWGACNLQPDQIAAAAGDQVERREVERCIEMLKAFVPETGIESKELEKLVLGQSVSDRTFVRARGQVRLKPYRKKGCKPAVWMWRPPVAGWPK
jgi:RecA-family ATPase